MRKLLALLLSLCMLLGCCAALAEEPAGPALEKNLVILYTSDVHCGIDQGWGYAGLYAIKENLSANNYVLLVDDGDSIQGEPVGTLSTGEAIIDIMNNVGYDIAIPGNHEFDYGMERFLELTGKANFPYISCNFNKEGELVFQPYIIKEFDGVKIAFIGMTTPQTPRSSTPKYFQNDQGEYIYGFMQDDTGEALYAAVQKAVDDARAEGANYVIAIAHLGNEEEVIPWRYNDVIENTTGIDVMLDGHSHDTEQVKVKNKDGEEVIRSAVGTKMANIGCLTIGTDGSISTKLLSWNCDTPAPKLLGLRSIASDAVLEATYLLNMLLKEVVAKTAVDLYFYDPTAVSDDGRPVRIIRRSETNLGDLCADAYRDQGGGTDIAFVNGGGIRVQLKAGDLTLGDILNVHPFGNSLTVIEVTGQQVLDALEWSVHSLPGEFGGFNQVSGITFEYDCTIESPVTSDENGMFTGVDETKEHRVRNVMVAASRWIPQRPTRWPPMTTSCWTMATAIPCSTAARSCRSPLSWTTRS